MAGEGEGFKIADAYVDVEVEYDDQVAMKTGERAGVQGAEAFTRGSDSRMRDNRSRFVRTFDETLTPASEKSSDKAGRRGGMRLMSALGNAVKGTAGALFTPKITGALGEGLLGFVKSPVGIAAIATVAGTLGTLLASGIASSLSVALGSGIGLGFIGLGAFLLRDEDAIVAGAKRIKKSFDRVFGGAAKRHFLGPMVEALRIINRLIKGLEKPIDAIFKGLAPAIVPLTRGFEGMIQNMLPGLTALMEVVGQTLGMEEPLMDLGKWLGDIFFALAENWPKINESFFAFMEDLGMVLGILGKAFMWLATNYETVRNVLIGIMTVGYSVQIAVYKLVTTFWDLAQKVPGWISGAWATISGLFTSMVATVGGFIGSVAGWFASLPGKIMAGIAALPGLVLGFLKAFGQKVIYDIGFLIGWIVQFWVLLPGRIYRAVSGLWTNVLAPLFGRVKTNAIANVRSTVDNVVAFFRALPGRARAAVAALWGAMAGAWNNARNNAVNNARNTVTGVVNWFRQLPGKVGAQMASMKRTVVNAGAGAGRWLWGAGKAIIGGLVDGIKEGLGPLRSTLGSVTNMIPDWKGPAERDAKLLEPNGRLILRGLRQGISKEVPALQRQLGGITGAVPAMAAPALAAPAGGGRSIGSLTVNLQGVWDFTDPVAIRKLVARLHRELDNYERSFA